MKKLIMLALLLALTLAYGPSFAAEETPAGAAVAPAATPDKAVKTVSSPPRQGPGARFRAADVNGDHKVTPEEFKAAFPNQPTERFNELDRNGDGVLTREETPPNRPPHDGRQYPGMMLKQADKDGDQKVTAEEFRTAFPQTPDERFKVLDRNADGVLTAADFPPAGAPTANRPNPPYRFKPEERRLAEITFEKLDTDGNGVLSKEEFEKFRSSVKPRAEAGRPAKPQPDRLRAADTDNDGKISLEEATAAGISEERFKTRDIDDDGYITKKDRKPKDIPPAP